MVTQTPFTIGAEASCTDGDAGKVRRVIVDPVARTLTHLVVEPGGRLGLARLVPLDLVDMADAATGTIRIRCTLAEFARLDPAEETQFVPGTRGYEAYGTDQVLTWPYYGLGSPGESMDLAVERVSQTVTYDTVPLGEVEVRRGDAVQASDGHIGHVQGLIIDPASHQVTHVLLQEGHLWGRKEVSIPIRAVTKVGDGISVSLSKQEIGDLPAVDIEHPGSPG
ncbi:MAG TPA: PRC-barrel domain-containing protein [Streptosporangiaceae bacterium]|nr:PRC-barrel domain-containing protein [Streptosporangiaceae bacterium]